MTLRGLPKPGSIERSACLTFKFRQSRGFRLKRSMSRLAFLLTTFVFAAPILRASDEAAALWANGVQPLLDQHCVKCHGPLEQKSGLELDTIEAVLKGTEDGPVIVPGKPDESVLLETFAPDADPHMPPKKQLSEHEIAKVRTWIAALGQSPKPDVAKAKRPGIPAASTDPVQAIDHFLAGEWQARGITPAPVCDDRTFVRRIYLDLAGRIPTREEASAFLNDPSAQKRAGLVDRLLASDEYPRTFREVWDALLMGRRTGRREQRRRESGWFEFLESAFKQDRRWDDVVHEMIVARPTKPEDKGALWFVFERRNEHQQVAEAVAPLIYGTKIDCAQCHDHPLAREIKQAHYWGLVAAFNRSKNLEKGPPAVTESAVGGFVNFTNLKKESQPAVMAMLTGKTIEEDRPAPDGKQDDSPDGYLDPKAAVKVPKFSRRAALAEAATKANPLLARSFVNHTWAILMGRGIVHPVDEMNSKNPPSHPELLDWLAADFATHDFAPRRLVRAIVLSRGYQAARWIGPNPPAASAFATASEKPLMAETIARSARVASGRTPEDATLRQAFAEAFPDVLPRVTRATIQQSMLLANSEKFSGLYSPEAGSAPEILASLPSLEDRVRQAFFFTLTREPDTEELARGVEFLQTRSDRAAKAAGQLLWALAAGPEFLTNH
jgi:mono/diheme cytochrome c family protein